MIINLIYNSLNLIKINAGAKRKMTKKNECEKKLSLIIYIILNIVIIGCLIFELLRGEGTKATTCFNALILMQLPKLLQKFFKFKFANFLETIIYLFIFATEILGSVYNFYYGIIPHWDSLMHTISGFLFVGVGLFLMRIFVQSTKNKVISPLGMIFAACCFSMTMGMAWELFEYTADKILLIDMQNDIMLTTISSLDLHPEGKKIDYVINNIDKTILYDAKGNELIVIKGGYLDIGLNDTMKDLIFNLLGALFFAYFGYHQLQNKNKFKFIQNFIPVKIE